MTANIRAVALKDLYNTEKPENEFILPAMSSTTLPVSADKQFWKQERSQTFASCSFRSCPKRVPPGAQKDSSLCDEDCMAARSGCLVGH